MTIDTGRPADPPGYPRDGSFADLLNWHLEWGTTPNRDMTVPNLDFKISSFHAQVYEISTNHPKYDEAVKSAGRAILNWREGEPPGKRSSRRIAKIFVVLFGNDQKLRHWKADLEEAYKVCAAKLQAQSESKPKVASSRAPTVEVPRVPFPTDHFCGRDEETRRLSAILTWGKQAVLLQGAPGIGKTELAKAVAHSRRVCDHFGTRCWFVSLGAAATANAMRDAIIRALGGASAKGLKPVLDGLGGNESLLILDSLETPWEAVEERQSVETLMGELARTPGLSILGTYRGRHQMTQFRWERHLVEPFGPATATELFVRIADPRIIDDERLDDFIELLGGVPLAIQLLAHRAADRSSLAPLWREWQERGVDILNLPDEPLGPTTSFSQSILLSLNSNRTTHDARRLFAMLGQLPTSMLDDHISAIFGEGALEAVGSLLRVGLADESSGRISLLPPVKYFASRKCILTDEDEALLREHYLSFTAKVGLEAATPSDRNNVIRMESEIKNIEWAFWSAFSAVKVANVGDALRGMSRFISLSHRPLGIFTEIEDFRYHCGDNLFVWAYKNVVIGDVQYRNGNLSVAERAYHRAAMLLNTRGYTKYEAEALVKYAEVQRLKGNYEKARELIKRARKIYGEIHEQHIRENEAYCFLVTAKIDFELGASTGNISDFLWATEYSDDQDFFVRSQGIKGLGDEKVVAGDLDFGRGLIEEALAPFRLMGCRFWEAHCLVSLGRIDLEEGKFEAAQSKFKESHNIFRQINNLPGETEARQGLEEATRARTGADATASNSE